MPIIHIDRLDLRVTGVDAATVQQALDALPAALPAALSAALGSEAAPVHSGGVVRVEAGVTSGKLAGAMAGEIAAQLRGRER